MHPHQKWDTKEQLQNPPYYLKKNYDTLFSLLEFLFFASDNHELPSTHIFKVNIFKFKSKLFIQQHIMDTSLYLLPRPSNYPCLCLPPPTFNLAINTTSIFFLTQFSYLLS